MTHEDTKEFVNALLKNKTPQQQITILKDCLTEYTLEHPWIDEELKDNIMQNIARTYNIPYETEY